MPTGEQAVEQVSRGQRDRSRNRESPIRRNAQVVMGDGCPSNEKAQPQCSSPYDARASMPRIPEAYRNNADRYDDNQHLGVQVALDERQQHGQHTYSERQREAMQQAEPRQADGGAVQPVRGVGRCSNHIKMPLC